MSFSYFTTLTRVPRACTVQAKADSVLWVIDRKDFKDATLSVIKDQYGEG